MKKQTVHLSAKAARAARQWYIVDAEGYALGRLASTIARVLRGKTKPTYSPHVDTGDFMVVVNAAKVRLTGNKISAKRYYRHTGYPGGIRERTVSEMLARSPERVIRMAVEGMLPKNRLGRQLVTKLKIYAGPDHPHAAQSPEPLPAEADYGRGRGTRSVTAQPPH